MSDRIDPTSRDLHLPCHHGACDECDKSPRATGFYWVRDSADGSWLVGRWDEFYALWTVLPERPGASTADERLVEIDERRLTRASTQLDMAIAYVRESYDIEGELLTDGNLDDEKSATYAAACLLWLSKNLTVDGMCRYASTCGGEPRIHEGMNVMVGDHVAPGGGPYMAARLARLVRKLHAGVDPVWFYHQFLKVHPFTDGNGRTARALWWAMTGPQWSFLQNYHYEVLRYMDNRAYVKPQENVSV